MNIEDLHSKQALKEYLKQVISTYQANNYDQFLTADDFKDIGQRFNYSDTQSKQMLTLLPKLKIKTDSQLVIDFHYFILNQIRKHLPSKVLIIPRKLIIDTLTTVLPVTDTEDTDVNKLIDSIPTKSFSYHYDSKTNFGGFNLLSRIQLTYL